jgi:hypothetical protein
VPHLLDLPHLLSAADRLERDEARIDTLMSVADCFRLDEEVAAAVLAEVSSASGVSSRARPDCAMSTSNRWSPRSNTSRRRSRGRCEQSRYAVFWMFETGVCSLSCSA